MWPTRSFTFNTTRSITARFRETIDIASPIDAIIYRGCFNAQWGAIGSWVSYPPSQPDLISFQRRAMDKTRSYKQNVVWKTMKIRELNLKTNEQVKTSFLKAIAKRQ